MRYYRTTLMILMALCLSGTAIVAQVSREWKKTSGPYGAELTALVLDKDGGAYAAVSGRGIYYMSPTGSPATWQPLGNDLLGGIIGGVIRIQSLAVSGDASNGVYAASQKKIFKLAHGSDTWVEISPSLPPSDGIEMIVMNSAGTVFCTTVAGALYKLNKGATSWQAVSIWGASDDATSLAIGRSDALFVGVASGGVMRSTDAGTTWSTVIEPTTKPNFKAPPKLVSSPSGDIYALHQTLQRSTDNGASWTTIPPGPPYGVNAIAVGSNDEIYIGTAGAFQGESGFYMTRDQGVTWTEPVPDLKNHIINVIAAGDRCYLGSREMVFRSTDHGSTWEHAARGLEYTSTELIDVSPQGVIAAAHGTRVSISMDRGASWMDRGALNPTAIRWDGNGELLMGVGKILKRSADSGITWTTVHTTDQVIRDIMIDELRRILLLVSGDFGLPGSAPGQGKLLFSPDNGATWTQGNTGLPADSGIADITSGPFGTLFAAINTDGIYRSLDGGRTWEKFHDIHPGTSFRKIAMDYSSGDMIAVGQNSISRYSVQAGHVYDHIYESREFYDVTISGTGYTTVATDEGVMVSADGSDQFLFGYPAPENRVMCLDVDAEGRFYAGVKQNGVWSTDGDIIASAADNAGRFRVSPAIALSPNPTADRLTVRYTLTEGRTVAIGLHDISGRAVRNFPATYQEAGDHAIDLDLGDLPAGTYFVGLKLGNITSATAPFVIRR